MEKKVNKNNKTLAIIHMSNRWAEFMEVNKEIVQNLCKQIHVQRAMYTNSKCWWCQKFSNILYTCLISSNIFQNGKKTGEKKYICEIKWTIVHFDIRHRTLLLIAANNPVQISIFFHFMMPLAACKIQRCIASSVMFRHIQYNTEKQLFGRMVAVILLFFSPSLSNALLTIATSCVT